MFLKKSSKVFFVNYFPLVLNDAIVIKSSQTDKRLSPSKFQQNKYQTL